MPEWSPAQHIHVAWSLHCDTLHCAMPSNLTPCTLRTGTAASLHTQSPLFMHHEHLSVPCCHQMAPARSTVVRPRRCLCVQGPRALRPRAGQHAALPSRWVGTQPACVQSISLRCRQTCMQRIMAWTCVIWASPGLLYQAALHLLLLRQHLLVPVTCPQPACLSTRLLQLPSSGDGRRHVQYQHMVLTGQMIC